MYSIGRPLALALGPRSGHAGGGARPCIIRICERGCEPRRVQHVNKPSKPDIPEAPHRRRSWVATGRSKISVDVTENPLKLQAVARELDGRHLVAAWLTRVNIMHDRRTDAVRKVTLRVEAGLRMYSVIRRPSELGQFPLHRPNEMPSKIRQIASCGHRPPSPLADAACMFRGMRGANQGTGHMARRGAAPRRCHATSHYQQALLTPSRAGGTRELPSPCPALLDTPPPPPPPRHRRPLQPKIKEASCGGAFDMKAW